MLDNILHYTTLIFAVGCFTIIYFKLLSATVNRVTSDPSKGKVSAIYTSFLVRLFLAFVFFYCLLKYYGEIRDIIVMIFVFIAVRYLIIRHEKAVLLKQNPSAIKTSNSTGFSRQKSPRGKRSTSAGKSRKIRSK